MAIHEIALVGVVQSVWSCEGRCAPVQA